MIKSTLYIPIEMPQVTYTVNEALRKEILVRRERITRMSSKLLIEVAAVRQLYARRYVTGVPDFIERSLRTVEGSLHRWYATGNDIHYRIALNELAVAQEQSAQDKARSK